MTNDHQPVPWIEWGITMPIHLMQPDDPRRRRLFAMLEVLGPNISRAEVERELARVPGVDVEGTMAAILKARCMNAREAVRWLEQHHAALRTGGKI